MYSGSLVGGDFDEAMGIIEGTGSGEFDGDYFVGTSSVAHMADETGSLKGEKVCETGLSWPVSFSA